MRRRIRRPLYSENSRRGYIKKRPHSERSSVIQWTEEPRRELDMACAEIFDLLLRGEVDELKAQLETEPSLVDCRGPGGLSLLMVSLYHQRRDLAIWLVNRGKELDLFEASALGDLDLVEAHTPTNWENYSPDGFSALHLAAFFQKMEVVHHLLSIGAPWDQVARNPTLVQPLHSAVAGGSTPVVQALLEVGADPNALQQLGFTPLMGAAAAGKLELVDLLLLRGALPDLTSENGQTAFNLALERGHQEIAKRVQFIPSAR